MLSLIKRLALRGLVLAGIYASLQIKKNKDRHQRAVSQPVDSPDQPLPTKSLVRGVAKTADIWVIATLSAGETPDGEKIFDVITAGTGDCTYVVYCARPYGRSLVESFRELLLIEAATSAVWLEPQTDSSVLQGMILASANSVLNVGRTLIIVAEEAVLRRIAPDQPLVPGVPYLVTVSSETSAADQSWQAC